MVRSEAAAQVSDHPKNGDEGNRTTLDSASEMRFSGNQPEGGAQSGAHDTPELPKDPDLAFIQHHWHKLSPEIRKAITHMVRASVQL